MPAETIGPHTIIGFAVDKDGSSDQDVYYVACDGKVKHIDTNTVVSDDADSCLTGDAVYGRDIANGQDATVKTRDQVQNESGCIAITRMTVWDKDDTSDWYISKPLKSSLAMCLMHKWYMEHGLMALYIKKGRTPINGFIDWVIGANIGFFTKQNRRSWYENAMDIDYEMEDRKCSFQECLCNSHVHHENSRHIIPYQYYDRFGLFTRAQRRDIWNIKNPNTKEEADYLLHVARTIYKEMTVQRLPKDPFTKITFDEMLDSFRQKQTMAAGVGDVS
jgi:hypothetical protein